MTLIQRPERHRKLSAASATSSNHADSTFPSDTQPPAIPSRARELSFDCRDPSSKTRSSPRRRSSQNSRPREPFPSAPGTSSRIGAFEVGNFRRAGTRRLSTRRMWSSARPRTSSRAVNARVLANAKTGEIFGTVVHHPGHESQSLHGTDHCASAQPDIESLFVRRARQNNRTNSHPPPMAKNTFAQNMKNAIVTDLQSLVTLACSIRISADDMTKLNPLDRNWPGLSFRRRHPPTWGSPNTTTW